MVFKPLYPGEVPTLGYTVLDWMTEYLAMPDREDYEPFLPTREQAEFILRFYELDPVTGKRKIRRGVISRPKGWGKAEHVDAVVPTPSGWSRVGDLVDGDVVFGSDGRPTRVVQAHPVIRDRAFRVTCSDGSSSVFHGEHLFRVGEFRGSSRVWGEWSVRDMYEKGVVFDRPLTRGRTKASRGGVSRFALPDSPVLQLPEADLPVPPYVLGYWLGDGDSDCNRITCWEADLGALRDEFTREGVPVGEPKPTNTAWRVRFGDRHMKGHLRGLDVLGAKHVPEAYLRGSVEQRLALLQGLMDSDGYAERSVARAEFSVTSRRLAEGVAELIRTLGYRVTVRETRAKLEGRDMGPKFRLSFRATTEMPVFRLPRKRERLFPASASTPKRMIVDITPVDEQDMRCITVEAEDGLYLTGETFWVTHNSPYLSAIAIAEGIAPVLFDGWDAEGRPVGKPWSRVRTPIVQLLAVSEDQTKNAWTPLLEMIRQGPVWDAYPGIDPMDTLVNLPSGRIEFRTSSPTSAEGNKPVFCILDQSESWLPSNGGVKLASVARRNLGKTGGASIEAPNAFEPGADSVAEQTFAYWREIQAGNAKDDGLLVDHREWPETVDLDDAESIVEGLALAYGDSADLPGGCVVHDPPCDGRNWPRGWVDLDRIRAEIWDPATLVSDASRFYGNRAHADADALVTDWQWAAAEAPEDTPPVSPDDPVVLGFDGSRHRKKGVTDATVLIAQRVSDGFSWPVGIWEQPDTAAGRDWEPPEYEIEQTLDQFMGSHHVVGFYADPSLWESNVASWEAKYGDRLKIGPKSHRIAWRTNQLSRVAQGVELLMNNILTGELVHDGNAALTRHVLNVRLRQKSFGKLMYKEFPDSSRKIDAAYGLMLATLARTEALSRDDLEKEPPKATFAPRKIR